MARSIVRFASSDGIGWGLLFGTPPAGPRDPVNVAPLGIAARTTADLLLNLPIQWPTAPTQVIEGRDLRSPVTNDAQIVCQGLNYRAHAEEASHSARRKNLFFAKAASSLSGAFDPIERPTDVQLLDYEVEIGLVIGKRIDRRVQVDARSLGDYVAGVVLCNDVSARDIMFGASFLQWYQGKSSRGFCPCGPILILLERDECSTVVEHLRIELSVNGEERQAAETSQLIFPPAPTLTELSAWLDLNPGDLLLTGTPGGVTATATPQFINTLREQLFDDEARVGSIRSELSRGRPFLRPGDSVSASLKDSRSGQLLSAHLSPIVDAGHGPNL